MLARRIFVLAVATILVGRTLHCCAVEATLCGASAQADDAPGTPLRNPDDSDPNESGCICKGALVNAPAPLEALHSSLQGCNPLDLAEQSPALAVGLDDSRCRPLDRHLLGPPPLGGKALRAWIGSLLI